MTVWLLGMLAIASAIMCVGLWPLVRAEFTAVKTPWYNNRALRLSVALYIHGAGAILIFGTMPFLYENQFTGWAIYVMWAAFGLWLVAKTLIISVSGRLALSAVLFAGWTAFCAFTYLIERGSIW